jgi:hypothetical protein
MESATDRRDFYLAYMLRLWQAGSRDGLPVWRASLENPHTGERLAFGDPQALFAFLSTLLASATGAARDPDATAPASAGHDGGLAASGENPVE